VQEQEALFAVAEFSVGLAGFAAVFVALVRRSGQWEAASAFRLELLLFQSLPAGLFAFLPVAFDLIGVGSSIVWRLSSLLFGLGQVLFAIAVRRRFHRLPAEAKAALSSSLLYMGYVAIGLMVVALFANAAGWPVRANAGPYFTALVVLLALASTNFIRTVTTRPALAAQQAVEPDVE